MFHTTLNMMTVLRQLAAERVERRPNGGWRKACRGAPLALLAAPLSLGWGARKSLVGFAFSYLLGFKLLPRMKNIARQKLARAGAGDQVPSCLAGMVADKPVDWEIVARQYDQMVKYATALRLGTAEAEQVLRRFTRGGPKRPACKAIEELGKAVKSVFVAEYIAAEGRRREIHEGLQVVENWNAADRRGLSPLFWSNANLYGSIDIEMNRHLDLDLDLGLAARGARVAEQHRDVAVGARPCVVRPGAEYMYPFWRVTVQNRAVGRAGVRWL